MLRPRTPEQQRTSGSRPQCLTGRSGGNFRQDSMFVQPREGKSVHANNVTEQLGAAAHCPALCFWIQCDQPEAKFPTLVPFEIVGERPVQIPTNIVPSFYQAMQFAQDINDEPGPNAVRC